MDAANRVMTRKALDMLKSIATGNYKPVEIVKEEAPAIESGEEKAAE